MDRDAKEARNQRIFEAWLSCRRQGEIAQTENVDQSLVSRMLMDFMNFGILSEIHKAAAFHAAESDGPIYNIWKRRAAGTTDGSGGIVLGPPESGVPTAR
jgi:hypothetical protein